MAIITEERIRKEEENLSKEIDENNLEDLEELYRVKMLRVDALRNKIKKIHNWKTKIIEASSMEKQENYKLFEDGIKNCLCCGYQTKKESITNGKFHLFSACTKCRSHAWLVGHNYPCEICNRISFTPLVHHIDGNRKNNLLDNLVYICQDCHTAIHTGIGKTKKSGLSKRRSYNNQEDTIRIIEKYSGLYYSGKTSETIKASEELTE